MEKRRFRLFLLFAFVLAFGTVFPGRAVSARAVNAASVTFTAANSWQAASGICTQYDVTVSNPSSSPVDRWQFALDLGTGGTYDQSWSCSVSQEGTVLTVEPMEWNARIDAGGSVGSIGIVLAAEREGAFAGSYSVDPQSGLLTKTEGPEPETENPEPETEGPGPETEEPETGTPETEQPETDRPEPVYPSGTGMYGDLAVSGVNLCTKSGTPVQLRGVSTHGLAWYPQFVNLETFRYLRDDWGVNLIRLAMYTEEYGGYCSGGDRAALENLIDTGVNACASLGMYCIIDWHILADNDPTIHKAEALDFFARMSAKYSGYNNVIYEICNEPHGVNWPTIKAYADEVIPVIRANAPDAIIIVGTNTWSQDILDPAGDPVAQPYNVMYAVHFYAASHGQWLRDRVVSARASGVPVFISEFSTCDASGNGAIDYNEAAAWKDLIMGANLSFAGWNLANKDESSSIVRGSCSKLLGWTDDEISDTGKWLRTLIREGKALEPEIILPDEDLDTLALPEGLTEIGEEAFCGILAECVIIPESVRTVGSRAFADSLYLEKVILKTDAAQIAEDAFEGCGKIEFKFVT